MSIHPPRKQVEDWIGTRWKEGADNPCEACGRSDWAIGDPIGLNVTVRAPDAPKRSGEMIVVPVICQHCANTRFVHARSMESIGQQASA